MSKLSEYVLLRSKMEKKIGELSVLQYEGLKELLIKLQLNQDVYFRPDPRSPQLKGRILIEPSQSKNMLTFWHFIFYPLEDGNLTQTGSKCYFAPDRLVKAVKRGEIKGARQ